MSPSSVDDDDVDDDDDDDDDDDGRHKAHHGIQATAVVPSHHPERARGPALHGSVSGSLWRFLALSGSLWLSLARSLALSGPF